MLVGGRLSAEVYHPCPPTQRRDLAIASFLLRCLRLDFPPPMAFLTLHPDR